jgi:type I restriction enzyme M protein
MTKATKLEMKFNQGVPRVFKSPSNHLALIIKKARSIMRKDKGLNGDLDRLPLLTWLMFLKFLDDLEIQRETEARMANVKFKPLIAEPYRWRDWAKELNPTGDELLDFINKDEVANPFSTEKTVKIAGLFYYLRNIANDADSSDVSSRRFVIATVFKGVDNRMKSGFLLRDVIDQINKINFDSSEELHTLGMLYEGMLRDMRDAAGDSGEFYTPRPLVKILVEILNPQLGEVVEDPASGTGGFLVEAFKHLAEQVDTVEKREVLQTRSVRGCEPKSLPFLLCQMNLVLHGMDSPLIDSGNSLRFKLNEIGEKERVDVILTNPPFGGEEEKGIQGNFPENLRTSETALLFLQLIMRKLRRSATVANLPARAAVVIPNGILSGSGVAEQIRTMLLKDFKLTTVLRLPAGVFAPYTSIPSNVLFFERGEPDTEVWFYEIHPPLGKKNFTKTNPLSAEHLEEFKRWWGERKKTESAWSIPIKELLDNHSKLDYKHPENSLDVDEMTFEELTRSVSDFNDSIESITPKIKLADQSLAKTWPISKIGSFVTPIDRSETVQLDKEYKLLGVRLDFRGAFLREVVTGSTSSATKLNQVKAGDFIYSRLFAWRGSFGIIPPELDGCYVSNEFPLWEIDEDKVKKDFLLEWLRLPTTLAEVERCCTGSTPQSRNRFKEEFFLALEIPVPENMSVQDDLIRELNLFKEVRRSALGILDGYHRIGNIVRSTWFGVDPITSFNEEVDLDPQSEH